MIHVCENEEFYVCENETFVLVNKIILLIRRIILYDDSCL